MVAWATLTCFIVAAFFIMILVGFAASDIQNFGSGNIGFGMGSSTLVKAGSEQVTEPQMSDAMQRRLQQVRQEKPDADYATIIGDFDQLLDEMVDEKTLAAFAGKFHFPVSKRLVDAEIAQIPQTKGFNGETEPLRIAVEGLGVWRGLERGEIISREDRFIDARGVDPLGHKLHRRAHWNAEDDLHRFWKDWPL